MKPINDEFIMAYVDGELTEEEIIEMNTALKGDYSLREKVARHHALRAEVDQAFNHIDKTPVPEGILNLLQENNKHGDETETASGNVVNLNLSPIPPETKNWWQPTSIAASLVMAFFLGLVVTNLNTVVSSDESLVSTSNHLSRVLDTTASGIINNEIEIIASFTNEEGEFCRSFVNKSSVESIKGLSCRQLAGDWKVIALAPAIPDNVYLPASGDDKDLIESVASDMKRLNAEEEKTYLKK